MNSVVIQKQALANTRLQVQVLGFSIAVDFERTAWFDTGQHAYWPIGDPVFSRDLAGEILLADLSRSQIAYRAARRSCLGQRRRLELLADPFNVGAEILQQNSLFQRYWFIPSAQAIGRAGFAGTKFPIANPHSSRKPGPLEPRRATV